MANISTIKVGSTTYNIYDTSAIRGNGVIIKEDTSSSVNRTNANTYVKNINVISGFQNDIEYLKINNKTIFCCGAVYKDPVPANSGASGSISFPVSFDVTCRVIFGPQNGKSGDIGGWWTEKHISAERITKTGFKICYWNSATTAQALYAHWIAISCDNPN